MNVGSWTFNEPADFASRPGVGLRRRRRPITHELVEKPKKLGLLCPMPSQPQASGLIPGVRPVFWACSAFASPTPQLFGIILTTIPRFRPCHASIRQQAQVFGLIATISPTFRASSVAIRNKPKFPALFPQQAQHPGPGALLPMSRRSGKQTHFGDSLPVHFDHYRLYVVRQCEAIVGFGQTA